MRLSQRLSRGNVRAEMPMWFSQRLSRGNVWREMPTWLSRLSHQSGGPMFGIA